MEEVEVDVKIEEKKEKEKLWGERIKRWKKCVRGLGRRIEVIKKGEYKKEV